MDLPLTGIRVAEFCQIVAGPFCGLLLADMGAEVIKIESPEGDGLRAWPPMVDGYSGYFAALNRNKRSIALDFNDAADRATARALALSCDIVIENFRPGVLAKFGLDEAALRRDKPDLVYCSVSAFGQSGPRAKEGGFDLVVQAMSGLMSVTGEAGGRPVKCAIPLSDFGAGLYAAFSCVSALHKVRRNGGGESIDVSMLGATLGIAGLQTSEYFGTGNDPVKLGSAHPMNAPYQAFRSRDGYFCLAAGNDRLWRSTLEAMERLDLADDARFANPTLRARNQDALREILEVEFTKQASADWLEKFRARGIPCAPINSYSEVLADPQVGHMGWVQQMDLPNGRRTGTVISPQRLSGANVPVRRRPPALGEHGAEIRAELAQSGGART